MTEIIFPQYQRMSLINTAEKLERDYYKVLAIFCRHIKTHCYNLKSGRLTGASLHYVQLCDALMTKLEHHLELRNEVFVPYMKELSHKEESNHNCFNCSGRCELNHKLRLTDLRSSLADMRGLLYDLRSAILQEEVIIDVELIALHRKMYLAENMISELTRIEEEHLVPKILKAQRNIHVAG